MAWLKSWKRLLELRLREAILATCQFGSPHKKEFGFLTYLLEHEAMQINCPGGHSHIPIQGAYAISLRRSVAHFFDTSLRRKRAAEANEPRVDGLESVVVNDILVSKEWRTTSVWSWKKKERRHINVLQAAAGIGALEDAICRWEDHRINCCIDSRVAKGALAKGRSSAFSLQPSCKRAGADLRWAFSFMAFCSDEIKPCRLPYARSKLPWTWTWFPTYLGGELYLHFIPPSFHGQHQTGSGFASYCPSISQWCLPYIGSSVSCLCLDFLGLSCFLASFSWTYPVWICVWICSTFLSILALTCLLPLSLSLCAWVSCRSRILGPLGSWIFWSLLVTCHGMPLGPTSQAEIDCATRRSAATFQRQTINHRERPLAME